MSKKDNFSQAMYEMFGIGKGPEEDESAPEEELDEYSQTESFHTAPIEPEPVAVKPAEPAPAPVVREEPAPVIPAPAPAPAPVAAPAPAPMAAVEEPRRPVRPAREEPAPAVSNKREDDFFDSFARSAPAVKRSNTTYFAEGTSMEGTIRCDSDLEIAGDFKGEIASNGKVTIHANTTSTIASADLVLIDCNLLGDAVVTGDVSINENSTVTGNVRAANVICSGVVNGNLHVTGNITLTESAQIIGDIKTGTMTTSRGAKVSGRVDMGAG